jgi:phage terminase large subunit
VSTAVKRITTGYSPRPIQAVLHRSVKRFNVIVCHRRFGKTVWAINHMIDAGLRCELANPRYAYLAPLYSQAKRVCWDYLKQYTAAIPGVVVNEADLRVDIPRPWKGDTIRFQLLGADNPMSLKGIYLDGVVLDEFGDMNPVAWREVIRPTLSDRGGWAIFIGTPKGKNTFFDLYDRALNGFENEDGSRLKDPSWFCALYKASETKIISDSELESAKREMTDDEYEQEFECSFLAGLIGAYFAKELARAEKEKRITKIHHDPALPVDTYWDLGINDLAAVWFVQSLRGRHRVIDYFEICGASIPEAVREVKKRPYTFGEWVFPHDANARDFSTGKAQIQIFYSLGCRPNRIVPRVGTKRESINAARMVFESCEFDAEKCSRGIKALSEYQRKWNAKNNVFEESPLHNWASNGADAFQTFALGVRPDSRNSLTDRRYGSQGSLQAETSYDPFQRRNDI